MQLSVKKNEMRGRLTNLGFPDFACTCVPLGRTGITQSPEGFELALFGGNFAGCLVGDGFRERKSNPCCLGFESITL